MNAGLSLKGLSLDALLHPVPLGITLGLFLGKQIGILIACWLGVRFRITVLARNITWEDALRSGHSRWYGLYHEPFHRITRL
jgi:NhaA family Na+:H+ antiporter